MCKLIKDQWDSFSAQFGKYRPLLDFAVAEKLHEIDYQDVNYKDPAAHSMLANFTPQRISGVGRLTQRNSSIFRNNNKPFNRPSVSNQPTKFLV